MDVKRKEKEKKKKKKRKNIVKKCMCVFECFFMNMFFTRSRQKNKEGFNILIGSRCRNTNLYESCISKFR